MAKQIKNKRKPNAVMEADQVSELETIYQDSIETLEEAWEQAREEGDEDILFDAIMSHYDDRLKAAFCVEDMGETIDMFAFGPQDYLYEQISGGLT